MFHLANYKRFFLGIKIFPCLLQAPAKDNRKVVIFDINSNQAIEDPSTESSTKIIDEFVRREKLECHRLLIIRKKKMKVCTKR